MATLKELTQKYLDDDQRDKFMRNLGPLDLLVLDEPVSYAPETFVAIAFTWCSSPEGYHYWAEISKDMPLKMANSTAKSFIITYHDPATGVVETIIRDFSDSMSVSAKEWAEDYAYNLADKGWYTVEEVKK